MISEKMKVVAVVGAYKEVIRDTRECKFLRLAVPDKGSKHFNNCVDFYNTCDKFGISLVALFLACFQHFPAFWCKKVFKRNWPSIFMVVAEKSRARGLKDYPLAIENRNGKQDEVVDFYYNQVKGLPRDSISALVGAGLFEGWPDGIRLKVMSRIEEMQ